MNCPRCASTAPKEWTKKTSLGYRTCCRSACKRTFNERTGTPFNYLEYPTDIVLGDLSLALFRLSQSQPLAMDTLPNSAALYLVIDL